MGSFSLIRCQIWHIKTRPHGNECIFTIKDQIIDKILTEIKRLYSMQNKRDLIVIVFCHVKELKNINMSIPKRGRLTGLFFFSLFIKIQQDLGLVISRISPPTPFFWNFHNGSPVKIRRFGIVSLLAYFI